MNPEERRAYLKVIGLCPAAGFVPKIAEARGTDAVLSLAVFEAGMSIVARSMPGFRSDRIADHALWNDEARFDLPFYRDPCANPTLRRLLVASFEQAQSAGLVGKRPAGTLPK